MSQNFLCISSNVFKQADTVGSDIHWGWKKSKFSIVCFSDISFSNLKFCSVSSSKNSLVETLVSYENFLRRLQS